MSFSTPGSLYSEAYPYVEGELQRLLYRNLLDLGNIPIVFRRSDQSQPHEGMDFYHFKEALTGRIRDIFFGNPQLTSAVITADTAFWVQHLLKNPERRLRIYNPHDEDSKMIPVRPNTRIPLSKPEVTFLYQMADMTELFPFFKQFFSHAKLDELLWRKFVLNLDEIGKYVQSLRESIVKGDKNVLVVTNHLTWANIPFLAFCFHYFLAIPKEQLYAMIGPAIMTSEFEFEGARRWMNLIPTWPKTIKGDTGYQGANQVQSKALKNTLRIMNNTNDGIRVVFVAPSGTSDKLEKGTCKMAYPSSGTQALVRRIGETSLVLPIGVNDTGIMDGKGLPKKGKIHVNIGEPIETTIADSLTMTILPSLVTNEIGAPIGEWYVPTVDEISNRGFT